MDRATLIAGMDFARARLLGTLETIEKSGQDPRKVLAWRPGPGRAHIGWQAMHLAATHDRYLNVHIKGGQPSDPELIAGFAGGTAPSDENVPTLQAIRAALDTRYKPFREYVADITPQELARSLPNGRTVGESIVLLTWHEGHTQGQIHLTWNLYKQSHGVG
jgi:hypothetical protein